MEPPKIKVLGIAPYEAMKNVMEKLARKRPQMEMDVYVGDLKRGVDIAQKNIQGNYDVIISRGGTAEMIGKVTHIPVIEFRQVRRSGISKHYQQRPPALRPAAVQDRHCDHSQ